VSNVALPASGRRLRRATAAALWIALGACAWISGLSQLSRLVGPAVGSVEQMRYTGLHDRGADSVTDLADTWFTIKSKVDLCHDLDQVPRIDLELNFDLHWAVSPSDRKPMISHTNNNTPHRTSPVREGVANLGCSPAHAHQPN
jgi:hypothetical protein